MEKVKCFISGKEFNTDNVRKGAYLRPQLLQRIQKDHPNFNENCFISIDELNTYRKQYLSSLIDEENGGNFTIGKRSC